MESFLANFFSEILPSVSIMLIGFLSIATSNGGFGVKINGLPKKILLIFGFFSLFLGTIFTFFVVIFQLRENYPVYSAELFSKFYDFFVFATSLQSLIVLVCIIVGVLCCSKLIELRSIPKYNLSFNPVISEGGEANILVENTCNKSFDCIAKVQEVSVNNKKMDLGELNPSGLCLRWENSKGNSNSILLTRGIPEPLCIIYGYGNRAFLEFNEDHNDGVPLGYGNIKIIIEFHRFENDGYVRLNKFTGNIKASRKNGSVKLEWLKPSSRLDEIVAKFKVILKI